MTGPVHLVPIDGGRAASIRKALASAAAEADDLRGVIVITTLADGTVAMRSSGLPGLEILGALATAQGIHLESLGPARFVPDESDGDDGGEG